MRRLWWLLRIAFHDWMWEGGHRPDMARRMARALPLYFSDPYVSDIKSFDTDAAEWADVTWTGGRKRMLTLSEPTTTWGGSVTYRYTAD